ncbi:hypothetical protein [Ktedonospora formicarum]|uniref:hypothetical protein n=1 Tax=Ktedonospora formicarum TaxID=2778364 RepID=UPI001C68FDDF|nr:hypothetical protein [Ktedonospora formicarum]
MSARQCSDPVWAHPPDRGTSELSPSTQQEAKRRGRRKQRPSWTLLASPMI